VYAEGRVACVVPVCGVEQRGRRCKTQNSFDWSLPFERFCVCVRQIHPTHYGTIALLERAEDAMKAKEKSGKREELIILRDDALVCAWFCCRSHEEKEGRRTKSNGGGSERARKESEPQKDKKKKKSKSTTY